VSVSAASAIFAVRVKVHLGVKALTPARSVCFPPCRQRRSQAHARAARHMALAYAAMHLHHTSSLHPVSINVRASSLDKCDDVFMKHTHHRDAGARLSCCTGLQFDRYHSQTPGCSLVSPRTAPIGNIRRHLRSLPDGWTVRCQDSFMRLC